MKLSLEQEALRAVGLLQAEPTTSLAPFNEVAVSKLSAAVRRRTTAKDYGKSASSSDETAATIRVLSELLATTELGAQRDLVVDTVDSLLSVMPMDDPCHLLLLGIVAQHRPQVEQID